jgi:hypothetical protein
MDGVKIYEIKNGETFQFIAEPGRHQIGVKVDFVKSDLFSFFLNAGETKRIEITTPKQWQNKVYFIGFGLSLGIGVHLFGTFGVFIGGIVGAILLKAFECRPQLKESVSL